MKKRSSKVLTKKQNEELKALAALPDRQIDTSDIPEVLSWSDAEQGLFYRPVKQQITLRLDVDVGTWFKKSAQDVRRYQTEINRALREYVQQHQKDGVDA